MMSNLIQFHLNDVKPDSISFESINFDLNLVSFEFKSINFDLNLVSFEFEFGDVEFEFEFEFDFFFGMNLLRTQFE